MNEHHRAATVVLATDGSIYSDAAATYLIESPLLNREFTVHVVHCVPDVTGDVRSFIRQEDINAWHHDEQEKAMRSSVALLRAGKLAFECHGLVGFAPARIVEYAKQVGAAAIVMGSHGRGSFLDAIIGSVARRVFAQAHCPVLLVKGGREPG